jgi:hypothetical protein
MSAALAHRRISSATNQFPPAIPDTMKAAANRVLLRLIWSILRAVCVPETIGDAHEGDVR